MSELATTNHSPAIAQYNNSPLIEAYLANQQLRPRSKETYRKALRYFFDWAEREGIAQPTRADVIRYAEELTATYSVCTASSYLTAVRSFFAFLNAEGKYPNIALGIRNPKNNKGHRKDALSLEQAKNVLSTQPRESLQQKRDYAITSLLFHTGIRTIEVQRANVEDLRSSAGIQVLDVWGKGHDSKDELVKIAPSVYAAIKEYLQAREAVEGRLQDTAPLFASVSNRDYGQRITSRSVSRICKEALKAAGYNDSRLTAHSFRHTAVTIALLAGVPIRDVQQMARHGSPLTTERYAHDIRRLNDAAEDTIAALLAG